MSPYAARHHQKFDRLEKGTASRTKTEQAIDIRCREMFKTWRDFDIKYTLAYHLHNIGRHVKNTCSFYSWTSYHGKHELKEKHLNHAQIHKAKATSLNFTKVSKTTNRYIYSQISVIKVLFIPEPK